MSNLIEMALTRQDALIKTTSLAPKFVEHFDKIYNDRDSTTVNHWASEMQSWLDYVINIRLKPSSKPLSLQQKMDWFFTCGSDSETLFPDAEEANAYDNFVDSVSSSNNVMQSLEETGIVNP